MHPNPAFRSEDRALLEALIDQVGFGMVFLTTPDGPRVSHTPIVSTGDGAIQFHLSRGNALARHLDGANALAVVNGPDAYVSPRWYEERDTVPTWDYVALELEGRVRKMQPEGLEALLHRLIERHEARLEGEAWQAGEASEKTWRKLFAGIVGFELEILAWRPTLKLSQSKPGRVREAIVAGHEANGSPALAQLMRLVSA